MIIKQPVWVSLESQRVCPLGRMRQLFIRCELSTLGLGPMHETQGTLEPQGSPASFRSLPIGNLWGER